MRIHGTKFPPVMFYPVAAPADWLVISIVRFVSVRCRLFWGVMGIQTDTETCDRLALPNRPVAIIASAISCWQHNETRHSRCEETVAWNWCRSPRALMEMNFARDDARTIKIKV